jgi:hypothetical protein
MEGMVVFQDISRDGFEEHRLKIIDKKLYIEPS